MKYRVTTDIPERNWKEGEIVLISGKVADTNKLEVVSDDTPHQHALVVADPLKVFNNTH